MPCKTGIGTADWEITLQMLFFPSVLESLQPLSPNDQGMSPDIALSHHCVLGWPLERNRELSQDWVAEDVYSLFFFSLARTPVMTTRASCPDSDFITF